MDKRRLGRGLEALLGEAEGMPVEQAKVAVGQIQHNPYQPRKSFDAEDIASLSESIKTHGVLQPLVVRVVGDQYQLVAGERRLRAAQEAGVGEVPVRVVDFNDQEVLEAALVENIQRTDLNPIEKAVGFKDYLDRFSMTQEQLAQRLGLDRSSISNLVNLLDLPEEIQESVRVGQITLGHAKVLKGVPEPEKQLALCREIIANGHSVRALESLVREQKPDSEPKKAKGGPRKTSHVHALEDELRKKLATRVEIRLKTKDKGQVIVNFDSNDDFERILEVLRK